MKHIKSFLKRYLVEPFLIEGMVRSGRNTLIGWKWACNDVSFRRLLTLTFLVWILFLAAMVFGYVQIPQVFVFIVLVAVTLFPIICELFNVAIELTVDLATGSVVDAKKNEDGFLEVEITPDNYTRLGREAKDVAGLPTALCATFAFFVFTMVMMLYWDT